ncbi:MAG: tail fiber protein [Paenibacillus sp.]|uniref:pyocin knob domain-containing protein n=1 Tax=Paenibacillus sp. TaxID=58172 RepID=UPI0025ECD845|nr:pyocin knob domain-containing protein [Paenibacillus sp.]MBR2567181.1 tail fiber protein [Paenibacillus sp.]
MPQETDRLKLSLPLGNETVSRESINGIFEKIDAGVATQTDLDALREAVSKMDIPDASLTQKGKVQLSNKTDGTSETVAATEKAVKAAVDGAIPRLIPDTRGIPTKPSDYIKSIAYSFKTGSTVGLPAELFVVLQGLKGWNDDSGGVTHEYASGGTTGAIYHRTGTNSNDTWGPWKQVVDQSVVWQKHQLTADNGKNKLASGIDLNSLVANGQYNGNNLTNAPSPPNVNEWWYVDVQCHTNGEIYVLQKASTLNGGKPTLYIRTKENGVWSPWSPDVIQSVVDAKNRHIISSNTPSGGKDGDIWYQYS